MKTETIIIGALALATALFAIPVQQEKGQSCCPSMATEQRQVSTPMPAKMVKGVQKITITIDGGKYSPSAISVVKGKPVELTFKAGKKLGCGDTVVFKSLNISKQVGSKPIVIKFTPKKSGAIAFTCGMGMYDGKVIVK